VRRRRNDAERILNQTSRAQRSEHVSARVKSGRRHTFSVQITFGSLD